MKASQKNDLISKIKVCNRCKKRCIELLLLDFHFQRSSRSVCRTVIAVPMTLWHLMRISDVTHKTQICADSG